MNTSKLVKAFCGQCLARGNSWHYVVAALGVLAVMFVLMQAGVSRLADATLAGERTDPLALMKCEAPPAAETLAAPSVEPVAHEQPEYRALATYLSKRYRVAQDATERLVGVAFDAGQQVGLDPLLILAVMAVESSLNPIAESEAGAKGLMQIIPAYHKDKLDKFDASNSEQLMLDPTTNILVGAQILKDYIRLTGSLQSGLQFYNGAMADTTSQYAQKVMAVQERLRQAASQNQRPATRSPAV